LEKTQTEIYRSNRERDKIELKLLIGIAVIVISIPIIAKFDAIVLREMVKCQNCGELMRKDYWFVPTFLEIMLFLAGVGIGAIYI